MNLVKIYGSSLVTESHAFFFFFTNLWLMTDYDDKYKISSL
jgi:hypothetical protein